MKTIKPDSALALPDDLLAEVQRAGDALGLSASEAARQALQLGLPLLQRGPKAEHDPLTRVSPWHPGELNADYADETDQGYPLKQFIEAQRWGD